MGVLYFLIKMALVILRLHDYLQVEDGVMLHDFWSW
jgi:hypothetical protein